MKRSLLSIIIIMVVISLTIGSAFACFSDTEESLDNVVEMSSLDLKVNDEDDRPWGSGVGLIFNITDAKVCTTYDYTVDLFNAGNAGGDAFLMIKNLVDPDGLAAVVDMTVWYHGSQVANGWLGNLAGQQIDLGYLPANGCREVKIELHAIGGEGHDYLGCDLEFGLLGCWTDTETSEGNCFMLCNPQSGTIGFWGSWNSHKTYTQGEIEFWLGSIDAASRWLGPTNVVDMVTMFTQASGGTDKQKFLGHYLAQRLDQVSGRQDPATLHDVAIVPSYHPWVNYLGLANPYSASGAAVIAAMESKHPGYTSPPQSPPTDEQFLIMKDVCDWFNNLWA